MTDMSLESLTIEDRTLDIFDTSFLLDLAALHYWAYAGLIDFIRNHHRPAILGCVEKEYSKKREEGYADNQGLRVLDKTIMELLGSRFDPNAKEVVMSKRNPHIEARDEEEYAGFIELSNVDFDITKAAYKLAMSGHSVIVATKDKMMRDAVLRLADQEKLDNLRVYSQWSPITKERDLYVGISLLVSGNVMGKLLFFKGNLKHELLGYLAIARDLELNSSVRHHLIFDFMPNLGDSKLPDIKGVDYVPLFRYDKEKSNFWSAPLDAGMFAHYDFEDPCWLGVIKQNPVSRERQFVLSRKFKGNWPGYPRELKIKLRRKEINWLRADDDYLKIHNEMLYYRILDYRKKLPVLG